MNKENKEGLAMTIRRGFKRHETRNSFGAMTSLVFALGGAIEMGFQGVNKGAIADIATGAILGTAIAVNAFTEGRRTVKKGTDSKV